MTIAVAAETATPATPIGEPDFEARLAAACARAGAFVEAPIEATFLPKDTSPYVSRRADGWSAPAQRAFLEAIAEGHGVDAACRRVGLSVASAYAFRRALAARLAREAAPAAPVGLAAGAGEPTAVPRRCTDTQSQRKSPLMTVMPTARLLIPALLAAASLGGCATIAGTVGKTYNTALVGSQEVPGPGDSNATGTAKVTADATTNQVCVDMTTRGLPAPTMAHIHQGARGVAGPVVLTLDTPSGGGSSKCYGVDKELAAAIIANPAGYYVNIHDAAHPKGAIRGQLAG